MKEKTYLISAVATRYGMHPQTLRLYEREGLLIPSRSQGNTRVYSDRDLEKLELILSLSREMGVNLAGIEIIINMRRKMELMQKEFATFVEELKKVIEDQSRDPEEKRKALVKFSTTTLTLFREQEGGGS